jgi:GNAT superfamily N-acetyltransferase
VTAGADDRPFRFDADPAAGAAGLHAVRLADRLELAEAMFERPTAWPPYMRADPVSAYHADRIGDFAEHQVLLLHGDRLVGHVLSIPFRWDEPFEDLPARGYEAVLEAGVAGHDAGVVPNVVAALEVDVDPTYHGQGVSRFAMEALAESSIRLGFDDLVVPVRPTAKHLEPTTPLAEHVERRRPDGLPEDPWLRVHARMGGRILHVAPVSITIPAPLDQWREWTGLALDRSGDVVVPGALVPLHVSVEHGYGVYVEPNVWVHHDLRRRG